MNKLLASLSIALLTQCAQADVLVVDFTTHGGYRVPRTTVDSVGNLTLTLNDDGTVDARLDVAADRTWQGVAIDSGDGFDASNVSQGIRASWGSWFGEFDMGVLCNPNCTGSASWTISAADKITSV